MKQSGIHTLASGNQLIWKHEVYGGRGSVAATFRDVETEQDVEDAHRFMRTIRPAESTTVIEMTGTREEGERLANQFMNGGSNN